MAYTTVHYLWLVFVADKTHALLSNTCSTELSNSTEVVEHYPPVMNTGRLDGK